jgi:2-oxoisovalerate dehydrogenase E2 component (dihydrolipoyl transacylase)
VSRYAFKLPDLGEGTVSAELVAWHVKAGEQVKEDQVIAEVMTEKAAVELPSPVSGRVLALTGKPGDLIAVGSELIVFDTAVASDTTAVAGQDARPAVTAGPAIAARPAVAVPPSTTPPARVLASPAARRISREAGIDLTHIQGSGRGGRISGNDVTRSIAAGPIAAVPTAVDSPTQEISITGVRRVIAQRMSEAKRTIPHFAYVEEVDVTGLESLRAHLNRKNSGAPPLTYLPFIVAALVRVLRTFPQCNATYDAQRGVIIRHKAVHVGIATQTNEGLVVPVLRNAQSRSIADLAEEIRGLSVAVRSKKAHPRDLSGSTITLSSLGKLGGIVSTPIINAPEVAIIGINKAIDRPVIESGSVVVRKMMNMSSSFDHRFVDGFDAAAMIQELKDLLEQPATIFMD